MLPIFGGNVPDQGYKIERSLRFNPTDTPSLTRTPAATSNRKTWTWSGWVKKTGVGISQTLFSAGNSGTSYTGLFFSSSDALVFQHRDSAVDQALLTTTQVFRDPSAWYHIMVTVDTTQSTSTDRIKIYVNGLRVTVFSTTTYFSLNYDGLHVNVSGIAQYNGSLTNSNYLSGYLTEINFIDGLVLGPESFGETDSITGVWNPKRYTGVYGQNGFYLPFKNNTSTTTLGWDYSNDSTVKYNASANGNAQISTAQSKFGGSSALFDGSGDYLGFTYSASQHQFGTDNFTIECWVRISSFAAESTIFFTGNDGNVFNGITFAVGTDGSVKSSIGDASTVVNLSSAASQIAANTWYHLAFVRNGSSLKLYKDGTEVASATSSLTIGAPNTSPSTSIGRLYGTTNQQKYLNGYLDDFRIYRGIAKYTANFTAPTTALPIASSDTIWQNCLFALPLNGSNASTVFPVYSPNNWSSSNLSVTAGSNNDSLIDVPTRYSDGSTNRGNYCTFNTVDPVVGSTTGTMTDGALRSSATGSFAGTIFTRSGKWYFEVTLGAAINALSWIGIAPNPYVATGVRAYRQDGQYFNGSTWSAYGASLANGDTLGVAYDLDGQTLEFFKNGNSQGQKTVIGITSPVSISTNQQGAGDILLLNCGQRPFLYAPPSGFKAINTYNLP